MIPAPRDAEFKEGVCPASGPNGHFICGQRVAAKEGATTFHCPTSVCPMRVPEPEPQ
jgi:hypothetical protein